VGSAASATTKRAAASLDSRSSSEESLLHVQQCMYLENGDAADPESANNKSNSLVAVSCALMPITRRLLAESPVQPMKTCPPLQKHRGPLYLLPKKMSHFIVADVVLEPCTDGREIDWGPVKDYVPLSKRTHHQTDRAIDTVHVFWETKTLKCNVRGTKYRRTY